MFYENNNPRETKVICVKHNYGKYLCSKTRWFLTRKEAIKVKLRRNPKSRIIRANEFLPGLGGGAFGILPTKYILRKLYD